MNTLMSVLRIAMLLLLGVVPFMWGPTHVDKPMGLKPFSLLAIYKEPYVIIIIIKNKNKKKEVCGAPKKRKKKKKGLPNHIH